MNNIKYIMFHYQNGMKPDFVIFNKRYIHKNVFDEFLNNTYQKKKYPSKITAGFLSIADNKISTYGNSESLEVESQPCDSATISFSLIENNIELNTVAELDQDLLSFINHKQTQQEWRKWYLEKY